MDNKIYKVPIIFISSIILSFILLTKIYAMVDYRVNYYSGEYSSIFECQSYVSYAPRMGDCYGFFASQKNDINYCYQAGGDSAIISCITRFSIDKNNVKYCGDIQGNESWRQGCIADYYIAKNDMSGCDKVANVFEKNRCLEDIEEQQFRQISIYIFYILSVILVVLTVIFITLKFSILKILNILTLMLFPVIMLAGYGFIKIHELSVTTGKELNLYYVILLFYVIFCFIVVMLDIDYSFRKLRENSLIFKKSIKLTYLYTILLLICITITSLVNNYQSYADIVRRFWELIFWKWSGFSGLFLIPVGIVSIVYSVRARLIKDSQYRSSFAKITMVIGTIFIIVGAVSILIYLSSAASIG